MRHEVGKISKNNITLIEYDKIEATMAGENFIQCGVVGFFATKKELQDLFDVLNYYLNIEEFAKCKVTIEGENVSLH
jgi:glutamate formiminotransferase